MGLGGVAAGLNQGLSDLIQGTTSLYNQDMAEENQAENMRLRQAQETRATAAEARAADTYTKESRACRHRNEDRTCQFYSHILT